MFLWNIAVTSLAEVWIEIVTLDAKAATAYVTSLAEVWIEISYLHSIPLRKQRHFPCGSVD